MEKSTARKRGTYYPGRIMIWDQIDSLSLYNDVLLVNDCIFEQDAEFHSFKCFRIKYELKYRYNIPE